MTDACEGASSFAPRVQKEPVINRDPARGKADLSDVSEGAKSSEDSLKVKEEVLVALWKHNSLSFAVCNLNGDIKSGIALRWI